MNDLFYCTECDLPQQHNIKLITIARATDKGIIFSFFLYHIYIYIYAYAIFSLYSKFSSCSKRIAISFIHSLTLTCFSSTSLLAVIVACVMLFSVCLPLILLVSTNVKQADWMAGLQAGNRTRHQQPSSS